MVNVRRLIDDVIEPQTRIRRNDFNQSPLDDIIREKQEEREKGNLQALAKSPFSNKLDITVNFPEQKYEESSVNIGGSVTDSSVILGNSNTTNQSLSRTQNHSSNTHNQYGQGDNIGGDQVQGDKINTQNNDSDLATAARDIEAIFAELDRRYDKTTPDGKEIIEIKAVKAILASSTLKARIIRAIREDHATAIEATVGHPAAKAVFATIQDLIDA